MRPALPPLSRPLVLLIEDEVIIGLDLVDAFETAGYRVAGPMNEAAEAIGWLARNTPDYAVADLTLKDGACHKVVDALRRRGVPVVIYSGQRCDRNLQAALRDLPWVAKPAGAEAVVDALARLSLPAAA